MRELARRRYDPLDMFDEMRRSFDSFFGGMGFGRQGWPAVDIRQEEDRYVLEADLPGMTEKDVDIRVDRDVMVITSRKEEQKEEKEEGYLVRERRRASFQRSFVLPEDIDRNKIDARFHEGTLVVEMPRTEKTRPKQIPVKKG
jgi:HSP20 family molecular chaperone IbpA